MKYPCNLIKDIMPLYHDNIASQESVAAVNEHFNECEECRNYYNRMCNSDEIEPVVYDTELQEQMAASIKKTKKKVIKKIALIIGLAILGVIAVNVLLAALIIGILFYGSVSAEVETYTDVSQYESLFGENADENHRVKWDMDELIWPETVTDDMDVKEFESVYYNPFDAQYLSYMTVTYDDEAYGQEMDRLSEIGCNEYTGYYSVTGFSDYELLAMNADSYQGFVYALNTGENTVTYVEIIFCNYSMDLDYTEYVPEKYLPDGFDATLDNPYRKERMAK